jgi:hypothetical protein
MIRRSRWIAAAAALLSLGLVASAQGRMVGAGAPPRPDSGTANFAITNTTKKLEYAAGHFTDKVLGSGAITYQLKILPGATGTYKVTSKKVVLYTGKGSLSGTATALVTVTKTSETITDGKLNLTKGFGSLKGDSLKVKFTGTANLSANQYAFSYSGKFTA